MTAVNPIDEIKRLYYAATAATIQRDLISAIELLKSLENEEEREKVAVYMDGLSQMRSEWGRETRGNHSRGTRGRSGKR
jgi:hypothetical protein